MTTEARPMPGRTRYRMIGLVLPLLIALVGAVMAASWLPDLPDPVAVHWSSEGADGFGSAWTMILLPLGVVTGFTVVTQLSLLNAPGRGGLTSTEKILVVSRLFMSVLLTVGVLGSLAVQRGLNDAADAPNIAAPMIIGAVGGFLLAGAAWLALPKAVPTVTEAETAVEPLDLAPSESVYWSRTVRISGGVATVMGLVVALAVGSSILASIGSSSGLPVVLTSAGFVMVLSLGMSFWRVRADRRGFAVRGLLGWPRVSIPATEIAEVRVVQVNPTADFGGWGWRWASGNRTGIILRSGEAIEVARRNGKRLVVTVDDAETAARVLQTLASRSPV
ncbi:DUF1648 domain-containing protein [Mycetocola zhadangensis]|uniref:DUF1648 domain-containing protein n=1 Tax=Mycetocola zhadangensis TaxID=1164595 RepID=A0A3L7J5M2_9MICO|nr:DUF1648 domain-containing protein [Mycetocola zhadangensis]RLQ85947.1 DUF1648 domain-containing protein [Mycetocola zhadangensis]GGE87157.1 hypothetical protein GCM10011313_07120 [Mycetocola zhadangensis]